MQLEGRDEEVSPAIVLKTEKTCPDFGQKKPKKCSDCVHQWLKIPISNAVLGASGRKVLKFFPVWSFFRVANSSLRPCSGVGNSLDTLLES